MRKGSLKEEEYTLGLLHLEFLADGTQKLRNEAILKGIAHFFKGELLAFDGPFFGGLELERHVVQARAGAL